MRWLKNLINKLPILYPQVLRRAIGAQWANYFSKQTDIQTKKSFAFLQLKTSHRISYGLKWMAFNMTIQKPDRLISNQCYLAQSTIKWIECFSSSQSPIYAILSSLTKFPMSGVPKTWRPNEPKTSPDYGMYVVYRY